MPVDCQRSTSGGKGNMGMFIERDPRICAAGLPSAQPDDTVANALQQYLLKDEVDALICDSIIPPPQKKTLPPLRRPIPMDKRNAGPFGDIAALINPPNKSKFQTLLADLKDTPYSSYWKKQLAQVPDPLPMFPKGFDIEGTMYGKKTPYHGRLYDLVMPKDPYPDKTPESQRPGVQMRRNYCEPAYNPDLTYGHRSMVDKRGIYAKCCLTNDKVLQGTSGSSVISSIQANYQEVTQPTLGDALSPNDNIKDVPVGYAFGILKPPDNIAECLSFCELNPGKATFKECLAHLNALRKVMSTRYLPTFFEKLYLSLKYFDKDKTGWLPKNTVYNHCGSKLIRFDTKLIEPLLNMWNAFDGHRIEYKTFCLILNYKEPTPEIPKIPDIKPECLDFRTTYSEMVKTDQERDKRMMAGIPSGRYFDKNYPVTPNDCCLAHRTCLAHESDMKSCLNPSVLTQFNVSHRDMYEKREPGILRKIFEAAGDQFTDESFNTVWDEAKKYHSQGWVCYETFRRALTKRPEFDGKKERT